MTGEVDLKLRALYRNLQQHELRPDNPKYVPLHEFVSAFGPDVIRELVRDVTWSTDGSAFFLSGLRGSGKSTQLLRLERALAADGYAAVRLNAEDYLNLRTPVDVVEFLFFLVGGISDAVAEIGWLPEGNARALGWERLKTWLAGLPSRVHLTPGAEVGAGMNAGLFAGSLSLKAELRRDDRFVTQLRRFLDGRLSELAEEANRIVADIASDLSHVWSGADKEWKGLVVLVDSLDHVRGSDFREIRRALVDLFDKQSATIKLENCRTVFIVPPWVDVDYEVVRRLANIKVATPDGEPNEEGVTAMVKVLEHRLPQGTTLSDYISSSDVERIIRKSGGHLRDLLRIVRSAATAAYSLPMDTTALNRGLQEVRAGLLPLADDEKASLRHVLATHSLPLKSQDEWEALAYLFDRHLVLGYKNGETWYGVHPLIAADVETAPGESYG